MLKLTWDQETQTCQLRAGDHGLETDEGLISAVEISLFTDRRIGDEDLVRVPQGASRRGWWADFYRDEGDPPFGSRLWLLDFAKITVETVRLAGEYAEEALAWLVDERIAERVRAQAIRLGKDALVLEVSIWRPGTPQTAPFRHLWEITANALQ